MMLQERLEDLSVVKFIQDLFKDSTFIKVVDAFPEEILELPTIAVESDEINAENFELGNSEWEKTRVFYIDVFAKSKTQRDEFSYFILNSLKTEIPVYDFNVGFDPTPPQINCLDVLKVRVKPIPILSQLTDNLYYRSRVTFVAVLNKI